MRTEDNGAPESRPGNGAEWVVFMHSGRMTPDGQRALQEWRAAAAENDVSFRRALSVWELSGRLADDPVVQAELAQLRQKARSRERRTQWSIPASRSRLAAAATILLAIAAATLLVSSQNTEWHKTEPGKLNVVSLSDGSIIAVNTDSRVGVRFSDTARDLTLDRGEVLFEVAKDAQKRPFTVHARNGEVRAVGTRFNIIAEEDLVTVTLLHGQVEVVTHGKAGELRRLLAANESAAYGKDGEFVSADPVTASVDRIEGWLHREWHFEDWTIERAVQEHNRYTTKPVRLADADWGQKKFAGRFKIDDPNAFVIAVQYRLQARAIDQGDSVLLVPVDD